MAGGINFLKFFLVLFILLLLGFSVFFGLTYLLKNQNPTPGDPNALPPSPSLGSFPPGPNFTKIGNYYFLESQLLSKSGLPVGDSVFAVLCVNQGNSKVIDVGQFNSGNKALGPANETKCWADNCKAGQGNLYLAYMPAPSDVYNYKAISDLENDFENSFNPPCFVKNQ